MTVKGIVTDPETGEVITHINENDRILRDKSEEYLRRTVEIMNGETYVKAWDKTMFALAKALSSTELQMVWYLSRYVSYETGLLTHRNGRPLTRKHISDETGLSVKTVDRLMLGLKEKQVIGRHTTGRSTVFTVNPWVFTRGKRINKTLYEFFKNSRWAKVVDIK